MERVDVSVGTGKDGVGKTCRQQSSHVIAVDIQERLGAAMPDKVLNRVIKNTVMVLRAAALLGVPITVTEQYPKGLGPIDQRIAEAIPANTPRIGKTCFSCAQAADFQTLLADRQRPQMILTGMEAHVCVLQTAFDLHDAGFEVFVVEDAICSRRLENYQNALDRLCRAGIVITNAESVLFEWLRDARHEHFKAISALLR